MSEMKEQATFQCSHELAVQVEANRAKFDGKYVVNAQNLRKFSEIYDFFCGVADDDGGEVVYLDIHPESKFSNISVEVSTVDLYKGTMKQFIDILQYVDLLEVKPTAADGLLISAGVCNVWEVVK